MCDDTPPYTAALFYEHGAGGYRTKDSIELTPLSI
jgi:hypothetical protein